MQNREHVIGLPLKSLLFAIGGLALFSLGVASYYFGISDGSLMFIFPLLISPFISVMGILYGIKAVRNNISPRGLATAGIVSGCLSILIIAIVVVITSMWVSGLAGVF